MAPPAQNKTNKQTLRRFPIRTVWCWISPHVICWADWILRRQNDCHKLIILIVTSTGHSFKVSWRPPYHRRTLPHRSRPCPAWWDGSWSAPWSTSAARRALSPGGDRVSMNSSSQKLVLRKLWHISKKKANSPPSPIVPPPPALPWGLRASFSAAFWLKGGIWGTKFDENAVLDISILHSLNCATKFHVYSTCN